MALMKAAESVEGVIDPAEGGTDDEDGGNGAANVRMRFSNVLDEAMLLATARRRFAAALDVASRVQFAPVVGAEDGDTGETRILPRIRVRFRGGEEDCAGLSEDASWDSEEFVVIPTPMLRALLRMVACGGDEDERERLRGRTMAEVSPRVFWSLVMHSRTEPEAAMRELVPEADWGFLGRRKRGLSKKAMENERQRGEKEANLSKLRQAGKAPEEDGGDDGSDGND